MSYDLSTIDRATAKFDDFEAWEETVGVPTRDNCDLSNPRQMFLWMFTCMPGTVGAPMLMAGTYWEHVSFQMWQLGATLGDEPVLKWQAPLNMVADRWSATGKWVSLDEPDPKRLTWEDVVSTLPQQDRAELAQVVTKKLGIEGDLAIDRGPTLREVADRLGADVDAVLAGFAEVGMQRKADDRVDRQLVDRVLVHMGLA